MLLYLSCAQYRLPPSHHRQRSKSSCANTAIIALAVARPSSAYTAGGTPISARYSSPTTARAAAASTPGLGAARVNVAAALIVSALNRPSSGSSPDGRSIATIGTSAARSEEHTSELQSLMRISYAVFGW